MKGDIALAGFVLTHEEWLLLDPQSREQLLAAAFQRDPTWGRAESPSEGSGDEISKL